MPTRHLTATVAILCLALGAAIAPSPAAANGAVCKLEGVPFADMNASQAKALIRAGGSCQEIDERIDVVIEECFNLHNRAEFTGTVRNRSSYNFDTFALSLALYDANGYLIDDLFMWTSSLRPGTNKTLDRPPVSGARCSEIERAEISLHENLDLVQGERPVDNQTDTLPILQTITKVTWRGMVVRPESNTLEIR